MKILAFESSCDETAVAVVEDGRTVLSDAIASQADLHALYGGVVPEIASRKHVEAIAGLAEKALSDAGVEILVCGTCLNFYGLTDQLKVGTVSNMYDIVTRMQKAAKVISL